MSDDTNPHEFLGVNIDSAVYTMLSKIMPQLSGHNVKRFTGLSVIAMIPPNTEPIVELVLNPAMRDIAFNSHLEIYFENAKRKAEFTLRTGEDSIAAVQTHRHLLQPGDFAWAGAVERDGVVVAVSGLTQDEDHWLAEVIASFILLEMRRAVDRQRDRNPEEHYFGTSESKDDVINSLAWNAAGSSTSGIERRHQPQPTSGTIHQPQLRTE